jgi:hypothetical protein
VNESPADRPVEALLSPADEGWHDVATWIAQSPRSVEVLPADRARRSECLLALQVTTRSVLGAMAWHTSGALLDHRWLRLLGGASDHGLPDLASASGMRGFAGDPPPYVVVAQDVVGGLFAVNGSGLPCEPGEVAYFAPDTLQWGGLGIGTSSFVRWALTGDTTAFYEQLRWPGWERESERVPLDGGLHVHPPLCTAEAQRDLAGTSRRIVPWAELLSHQETLAQQLGQLSDGDAFRLETTD